MRGLHVGRHVIEEILHRDDNTIVARAVSSSDNPFLVFFHADSVSKEVRGGGSGRKLEAETLPPPVDIEFVSLDPSLGLDGVLPMSGYGRTTGWTVFVYPFVQALPLAIHLKSIPSLRRGEALGHTMEVAAIIERLHRQERISTDINLGNVLIDEEGRVYLLYNRTLDAQSYTTLFKDHPQIRRYDVIAPEQVWGNGSTASTDIFQLGALLVSCLTRRLLVLSPAIARRDFQAALSGAYPPQEYFESVPKPFDSFVKRSMAPDPPDRFENLEEVLCHLKDMLDRVRITDAVSEVVRQGFVRKKASPREVLEKPAPVEAEKKRVGDPAPVVRTHHDAPELWDRVHRFYDGLPGGMGIGACIVVMVVIIGWGFSFNGEAPTDAGPVRHNADLPRDPTAPTRASSDETSDDDGKTTIDLREFGPQINSVLARPTDLRSFESRRRLLQNCYLALPREHRGEAIPHAVFQQLHNLNRGDRTRAYRLLDETFADFNEYLRTHGALL